MRRIVANAFAPLVLLAALVVAPKPAAAADLDRAPSEVPSCLTGFYYPPYFGLDEPWSTAEERPPRRGVWWSTQQPPSGVNALVPMRKDFRCVRPEPWTPAWYAYCAARYPSFNPDTGTIRTADGVRMCK